MDDTWQNLKLIDHLQAEKATRSIPLSRKYLDQAIELYRHWIGEGRSVDLGAAI